MQECLSILFLRLTLEMAKFIMILFLLGGVFRSLFSCLLTALSISVLTPVLLKRKGRKLKCIS